MDLNHQESETHMETLATITLKKPPYSPLRKNWNSKANSIVCFFCYTSKGKRYEMIRSELSFPDIYI